MAPRTGRFIVKIVGSQLLFVIRLFAHNPLIRVPIKINGIFVNTWITIEASANCIGQAVLPWVPLPPSWGARSPPPAVLAARTNSSCEPEEQVGKAQMEVWTATEARRWLCAVLKEELTEPCGGD
jgi:hypothetical protein